MLAWLVVQKVSTSGNGEENTVVTKRGEEEANERANEVGDSRGVRITWPAKFDFILSLQLLPASRPSHLFCSSTKPLHPMPINNYLGLDFWMSKCADVMRYWTGRHGSSTELSARPGRTLSQSPGACRLTAKLYLAKRMHFLRLRKISSRKE
jgi:hypothetical protein